MTRQRQVILEVLLDSGEHPTGDEVYRLARRRLPHISLGTVYRNLEVLSEAGLVRKLELGGAPRRFDAKLGEHQHIRCLRCGKLEDIMVAPTPGLAQEVEQQTGYEVVEQHLELVGSCPRCRKQREGKCPR